jgi:type IV fimbrial biogenesis protein FimT
MGTRLNDHGFSLRRKTLRTCFSRFKPYTLGFSVIELMIVVAIAAILMAIAIPSFSIMMQRNRLSSAASAMQVSLSLARSEAIKRGIDAKVTVAPSTTAGEWGNGWAVFLDKTTDANGAVAPTSDSSSVVRLEIVAAPAGPISFNHSGSVDYFMYNGQGRVVTTTGAAGNHSFWFFDGSSDKYCLIVSVGGRVRTAIVDSATTCPSS